MSVCRCILIFWPMLLLAWSAAISAQDTGGFPVILQHSDNNIAVDEGDKINVNSELGPGNYSVTWIRQRQVLCKTKNCLIDTKGWSYGRHRVVMVVYNNFGSRSVTFQIRIFTRESGKEPQTITPPLVSYQPETELSGVDDLVAKSKRGIVYSYSNEKIQVLAMAPRNLFWNETLKTEPDSIVEFGRPSHDQHFIIDRGKVDLTISEDNKRIIDLNYGALRSRQIDGSTPEWSIRLANLAEIHLNSQGDILVQRYLKGTFKFVVQVIRGVAQLSLGEEFGDKVIHLPQGTRIEVGSDGNISPLRPLTAQVGEALFLTSRHYLNFNVEPEKAGFTLQPGHWLLPESRRNADLKGAMQDATENLQSDPDPLLAIEVLRKHAAERSAQILLADAYFRLGAYGAAERMLASSWKEEQISERWLAVRSQIWLLKQEYEKVFDLLYDVEIKNDGLNAHLYYRGVAQFHLGLVGGAFNDFKDCSELCADPLLQKSAKEFMEALEEDKWYRLYGFIGAHYVVNLFRLENYETHYNGYANDASGYYSGLGAWLRMYENRHLGGYFQFDLSRRDYFDKILKKVEPVFQRFKFDFDFKFGGLPHKPLFLATFDPYLTMQYFASERIADRMGIDTSYSLPLIMFQPGFFYNFSTVNDPLPERDDLLDPVTFETVSLSDRSTSLSEYGLMWNWYQNEWITVFNRYSILSNKHKDSLTKGTDYTQKLFRLGFKYQSNYKNHFEVSLFTRKRSYENVKPNRIDDALGLDLDWRHFVHPFLFLDSGLNYISQDSIQSEYGYKTFFFRTGFGVQL